MKKIQKTRESYYDVFVAYDGTEFTNHDDCLNYEGSARGVIMSKVRRLVVKETNPYAMFGIGSEDDYYLVLRPTTQQEADDVMQAFFFENSYLKDPQYADRVDRASALVQRCVAENDILFVSIGYERDCFYIQCTRNSLKESVEMIGMEKKENA